MVMNAFFITQDLNGFDDANWPNYAEFDNKDKKISDGRGTAFYVTIEFPQGDSDATPNREIGPVRRKFCTMPFAGSVTRLRYIFHKVKGGSTDIPSAQALVGVRIPDIGKNVTTVLGPGSQAVFEMNEHFDKFSTLEFFAQAQNIAATPDTYIVSIMGEVKNFSRRQ